MRTLPQKASLQRRPSAASPTDTPAAVFRQGQRGNSVYRHYAHGCDPGRLAAPDGLMDLGAEAAPATAEGGIRPFVFGCARRGAPPSPERTAGVYTPARPLAPQGRTGTERQDAADPVLAHADAGRGPRAGHRVGGARNAAQKGILAVPHRYVATERVAVFA